MFQTSLDVLRGYWNLNSATSLSVIGDKKHELTDVVVCPYDTPIKAQLLTCRIEDIAKNIRDKEMDIGIITSDVLSKWKAARGQVFTNQPEILVKDIGFAGSRPIIGVAQSFLSAYDDSDKKTAWRDAVILSCQNDIPIYTSFADELASFLTDERLPLPRLLERAGTVEAQGKMAGSIVIADLVNTGNSMRDNGYEPTACLPGKESRTLLVAQLPSEQIKRAQLQSLFDVVPAASATRRLIPA